jgi:hypothetical protein
MRTKPRATAYALALRDTLYAIDSKYFDYKDEEGCRAAGTEADAAYHLATWLFDQGFMLSEAADSERLRKRLKKYCSPSLYILALEYFIDGRHDT